MDQIPYAISHCVHLYASPACSTAHRIVTSEAMENMRGVWVLEESQHHLCSKRARRWTQETTGPLASPSSLVRWWSSLFWMFSLSMWRKRRLSGVINICQEEIMLDQPDRSLLWWHDWPPDERRAVDVVYLNFRKTVQAGWVDSEVDSEIVEGQSSKCCDQWCRV